MASRERPTQVFQQSMSPRTSTSIMAALLPWHHDSAITAPAAADDDSLARALLRASGVVVYLAARVDRMPANLAPLPIAILLFHLT